MQIRKDRLKQLLDDGPPDRLLDLDTAADRLSIEPETLRRWIEQGRIFHVRLGRALLRVRESDVNRIIAFGLADKDNVVVLRGDAAADQDRDGEGTVMTPGAAGRSGAVSPISQALPRAAKIRRAQAEGDGEMLALLLTVEETAAMLKLHPQTVRGFIKSNLLMKVVLGRAVRLRRDEVEALARLGTVGFAAERARRAAEGA